MNKGQIIRRVLNDGTPIGPFLICDAIEGQRVLAHSIDPFTKYQFVLSKKHVYECKTVRLFVSKDDINHLIQNKDYITEFKHKETVTWLNAAKDDWDVVILQCRNLNQKIYYADCMFKKMLKKERKSYVIHSSEKVYHELKTYIKVYFGRFIHYEKDKTRTILVATKQFSNTKSKKAHKWMRWVCL